MNSGLKSDFTHSQDFELLLETTLTLQMHQKGIFVYIKNYRLHLNSLKELHQPSDISVLPQEIDDQFSGIHFNVSNDLLCAKN